MEDMKCPYEDKCAERFTDEETTKYRLKCDFINCALCDIYWTFYDEQCNRRIK